MYWKSFSGFDNQNGSASSEKTKWGMIYRGDGWDP